MAFSFGLCQMAWFSLKEQLILAVFYRPCDLEGVAGYKKN